MIKKLKNYQKVFFKINNKIILVNYKIKYKIKQNNNFILIIKNKIFKIVNKILIIHLFHN